MANNTTCSLSIDNSFGPWAGSDCRGGFDFTLMFEETLLGIVPAVTFLGLAVIRLVQLVRASIKTRWSWKLIGKMLVVGALSYLELTSLILRSQSPYATRTTAASTALIFTVFLTMGLITFLEHQRSYRPSQIITLYLVVAILFDIPLVRTLYMTPQPSGVPRVATAALAFKCLMLAGESVHKKKELLPPYQGVSPETLTGLIGQSFFSWLNSLMLKGSKNDMSLGDMFPLDPPLEADLVIDQLNASFAKKKKDNYSLIWLLAKTYKWSILRGVVPRLCVVALTFAQPFMINTAITLTNSGSTEQNKNFGYGMIGAYALVYLGLAVATGQYAQALNRTVVKIRGALVGAIYQKTLRLPAAAKDSAEAITLMNTDVERVTAGLNHIHDVWGSIVELAIAIWILSIQIGAGAAIPVAFGLLTTIVTIGFSAGVGKAQQAWLVAIQNRTTITSKTLTEMKSIKLSGLTAPSFLVLQELRKIEVAASKGLRIILLWTLVLASWTPALAPVVTFVYFALQKNSALNIARAFTSLSIINILATPLTMIFQALPALIGAFGCIKRIQVYLQQAEVNVNDEYKDNLGSRDGKGQRYALDIRDGRFGWSREQEPLLSEITFFVPENSFAIIYGPVGCGKSTLLKGILGELDVSEGVLKASSSVAYCEQSPWLPNGTVKQAICGFSDVDEAWYQTVLHACALTDDITQWPLGDGTIVGSTGIAMSGGQKQRISLARAVYARRSLILLDDTFSGLDNETEHKVFHRLLGLKGILRQLRTTVILATANSRRIPYADHIVILGQDGKVREQGGYERLLAHNGAIAAMSLQDPDWRTPREATPPRQPKQQAEATAVAVPEKVEPSAEPESNTQKETKATGDFSVYAYYFRSMGYLTLAVFVAVMVACSFCTTFPSIWLKNWSEANVEHPGEDTGKWLGVYAALGIISSTTLVIGAYILFIRMVPKAAINFHEELVRTVKAAPLYFFSTTDTGTTLNRFTQDLQLIDMELPGTVLLSLIAALACIGELVVMAVSAKYIAIAAPFLFVVGYFLQKFYLRTSRQLRFLELESRSLLYSHFMESLAGLATLRAFQWQREMTVVLHKILDTTQKPFYLLLSVQRWLNLVIDMMIAIMAVVLIVLATQGGSILSPGFTGVAMINLLSFNASMKLLITSWTQLETSIGSIARVKSFVKTTEKEEQDPEDLNDPPFNWPDRGSIRINNVSARYGTNDPILKDVSLNVAPGQKVAICGRTGSGKSSLVLCLFRMLDIERGRITVDSVDISTVHNAAVRKHLVAVPQDAISMAGTVRWNADPDVTRTDEEIWSALNKVMLKGLILSKGGLDASIDAMTFSHGQMQLFCFARAMLRKPRVLVLDEATSSVDADTEAVIQHLIRHEFRGCTIIAVVHKMDAVSDFDKVAVMQGGRVVEYDAPSTLLADPASAFSAIYRSNTNPGEAEDTEANDGHNEGRNSGGSGSTAVGGAASPEVSQHEMTAPPQQQQPRRGRFQEEVDYEDDDDHVNTGPLNDEDGPGALSHAHLSGSEVTLRPLRGIPSRLSFSESEGNFADDFSAALNNHEYDYEYDPDEESRFNVDNQPSPGAGFTLADFDTGATTTPIGLPEEGMAGILWAPRTDQPNWAISRSTSGVSRTMSNVSRTVSGTGRGVSRHGSGTGIGRVASPEQQVRPLSTTVEERASEETVRAVRGGGPRQQQGLGLRQLVTGGLRRGDSDETVTDEEVQSQIGAGDRY